MNKHTFNLETNYLQHDKIGAHYSKKIINSRISNCNQIKEKRNAKRI